jgi:MHS family proline/betaine transporter-like MFS transporter
MIAKPLGALFFGRLGDRTGRAKTVAYTLFGMGAATLSISFLPTYETAGWIAPALLGAASFLQNFFAAGETTGGALVLLEQTEKKKQGWQSSLFDASSILGILFASGAAYLWGDHWRILFAFGALPALMGPIIRRSPTHAYPKWEWRDLWRYAPQIASIAVVIGYSYGNYYLVTSFMNGFLPLVTAMSTQEAMALNTCLLGLNFFLLPFFGALTLKMNKERLMKRALIAGLICSLPCFLLLENASFGVAAGVRLLLVMIGVAFSAPYHAWAMDRCPPHLRFTLSSVGFAIGSRFLGAPIPALSLWLYHHTHWIGAAALPILGVGLLAGLVLFRSRYEERVPQSAR